MSIGRDPVADMHAMTSGTHTTFSSAAIVDAAKRADAVKGAWQHMLGLDALPRGSAEPELTISQKHVTDLTLVRFTGGPSEFRRSEEHAEQSGDDIILCLARGADVHVQSWQGNDAVFPDGGIHVWQANRPMWGEVDRRYEALLMVLPRATLSSAAADLERITAAGGIAEPRAEAALLSQYVALLFDQLDALSGPARDACLAHLIDLAVLALSAGSDTEQHGTAVRAARLAALKRDILAHLHQPELSPDWFASRHGISTRYLRALFADEQSRFTDFVLEQRLAKARRILSEHGNATAGIGVVAYRCGFGDLSYFNRSFRRRFGMTPSEARAQARLARSAAQA